MKKLIALLTAAVATLTSAWAATPIAVWEGNFPADGTADQNFTLTYATGNTLETDADTGLNYIKIGSTTGLGVSFMRSSQFGATTVLVKYSDYSPSAATTLATFRANNSNNNRVGIAHKADGTIQGLHSGANFNDSSAGNKFPAATDGMKTIAFRYSTNGVACYDGETELYRNSGYKWSSDFNGNGTVNGVTLGGAMGSSLSEHGAASGMKIHAVAVFNSEMSGADIAAYKWPSAVTAYTGTVAGGQVTWDKPLPETPAANDYLKFVGAGDIAVPANYASFGQITIGEGVNLTGVAAADIASGKFTGDGAIVITSNCTLTVPVDVKVKTRGDIAVTLTNDGTFEVENGTCSVNAPENEKIAGTIIVRSGATFKNVRVSDAIKWGGTVNIHVYGTLDFDETRWTLGANNNIYLYAGAVVMGSGQGTDGALDFNGGNGTIYVKPNGSTTGVVTCSAPMRNRQGGTINVDQNMVFETTGNVIKYGNGVPTKVGSGVWSVKGGSYESGATVNAGTLKLVGVSPASTITMGNGTLELSQNEAKDAFTFTGTVASAALGNGTIKTAGSTVTLSGTFTNYSGDIDSSAADSKFIIPVDQEVTVGLITSGSKIEIEGMLVHTNKATNAYTNYQGKNLSGLTGNGTFKITGPHYFFTCGTSNLNNYWASTLAIWNERGDSTIADNKGIIFGQPNNANATITIGSLSGAGLIRSDANSGERTIKIVQAKNTEWSGAFNAGDRVKAVIVTGADGATEKTLTLSGTQTHNNDLTIESAGSVKLTGTWIAETVTVAGRLEVLDTATLTATTLTSAGSIKTVDSTIYFGSDELASAEAAAKIGTTYYVTLDAAITALTEEQSITDIAIIDSTITTLPEGCEDYKIENGAIVARTYVAKVGDKKYETFAAAKADCTGTETIVIISDVDLAKFAKASENTNVAAIEIAEGVTVKGYFPDGGETLPLNINGTFWVRDGYTTDAAHPNNTAVVPVLSGNGVIKENITTSATPTVKIEDYTGWKGSFTQTNNNKLTLKFSVAKSDSAYYYSAEEAITAVEGGTEVTNISLTDEDIGESYTIDEDGKIVIAKTATELFLEGIAAGGEVALTGDVTLDATAVIPADKTVTLDLNGYTITAPKTAISVLGTLTVKDNGTDGKIVSTGHCGIAVGDGATLTVNAGIIESVEGAIITGKSVGAKITINGGTFSASDNAVIAGNGSVREGEANTITINGGTFNGAIKSDGYIACGIYAPWKDQITVDGGTFNITGGCGVCARAGNVKIGSGVTINLTNEGTVSGWVGDNKNAVPGVQAFFDYAAKYPGLAEGAAITSVNKLTIAETQEWVGDTAPYTLADKPTGPQSWTEVTEETKVTDIVSSETAAALASSTVTAKEIATWASANGVAFSTTTTIPVNALIFNVAPSAVPADPVAAADAILEDLASKVDITAMTAGSLNAATLELLEKEYPMANISLKEVTTQIAGEEATNTHLFTLVIELK